MSSAECEATGSDGFFVILVSGSAAPTTTSIQSSSSIHYMTMDCVFVLCTEVLNFVACAAASTVYAINVLPVAVALGDGHFRKYVCDNVDRNLWTIDSKTSLHAVMKAISNGIHAGQATVRCVNDKTCILPIGPA